MNNSLKEKIRYWFEFLKIAHESDDPFVKGNLKKSFDYYSGWGNYRSEKFDAWWKSHSHLFRQDSTLSICSVGEVVTDEQFFVRIPFTYAPTSIGRIVTQMYDRELKKRGARQGKTLRQYKGTYNLSSLDYQVSSFRNYLVFVRDVYIPLLRDEPRAKTGRYIEKCREVFGKLKKRNAIGRDIPFTNDTTSYESHARLVRRYRQMSEKLLRNVSKGVFPGDYEETFVKNQMQLRAEKTQKSATSSAKKQRRGRPKSMDVVMTKRVSGDDPYAGAIRKTRSDKGKKRGSYLAN